MLTKNKRAVSALVATVLLILITVAAVGIIWGAIMPMMNQAMQMGQACLNARLTIDTRLGYTCYKVTDQEVQVMVSRGSEDFEPAGMHIVISGGGKSKTFELADGFTTEGAEMMSGATPTTIEMPGRNEDRTYVLFIGTNLTSMEEAGVAPVAKVGDTKKVCDISSRVALTECSTSP